MGQIALHTRLKAGRQPECERVHASIPPELDAAMRESGVRSWRIWRDGRDLLHLLEVEDYQATRRALRDHPASVPWRQRMAELLDVPDSYEGDDRGMALVWALP